MSSGGSEASGEPSGEKEEAEGGGSGLWKVLYVIGVVIIAASKISEHARGAPAFLVPGLDAAGGLMLVFGSCEAMILAVEGLGARLGWNDFVAGTMAGLASNVPEIITIAFVVAKEPRVAFVVACLTLHVNALVFAIYSGLLPKDKSGHAHLPSAIVKQGADLLACAAGLFLAMGTLMLTLRAFESGDHKGEGLGAWDLIAVGIGLIIVEVISVIDLIKNFSGRADTEEPEPKGAPKKGHSTGAIVLYSVLGIGGAFLGGEAVGDFADALVKTLTAHGVSEMVGAIILSLFSGIASYLMIASAHMKKKYDLALSNVAGAVTQMPFVVLPATLILMAVFSKTGVIPVLPHGGVLAIDFETTSVLLFAFPTLLVMWKAITDDGKVNKIETTIMIVLFALIIYFLAQHG
jgi:hypothetical protein